MTAQEAYVEGFCKTAEAYGVDPEALAQFAAVKQAEDNEHSTAGMTAGGILGGLLGVSQGGLADAGFKRTLIDVAHGKNYKPGNHPHNSLAYRTGSKIRESLVGKGVGRKYMKLMRSGKGSAISAALLGLPTIAGAAGGMTLGDLIGKALKGKKKKKD